MEQNLSSLESVHRSLSSQRKKAALPFPGNPAISQRSVAFRPRLPASLAFLLGFHNKHTFDFIVKFIYSKYHFFYKIIKINHYSEYQSKVPEDHGELALDVAFCQISRLTSW
jgi:hypothetical protein